MENEKTEKDFICADSNCDCITVIFCDRAVYFFDRI